MDKKKSFRKTHIGTRELQPATQMTAYGYDPALSEGAVKPPVFLTSTFAFQSAEEGADFFDVVAGRKAPPDGTGAGGLVYSRFNHPNTEIIEDRLAIVDGGETALVTSSGMAAISAVFLTLARPGDQVVRYTPIYGGTETLIGKVLAGWGVGNTPFADGLSADSLRSALDAAAQNGSVKIVFIETPANPTNAMVDIAMCRSVVDDWAKDKDSVPVIVCDNTMLGPIFQKPIGDGVDICVYSLTKYVGGHSDLIAGAVTGSKEMLAGIRSTRSAYGFQLDPHSCWMLARSMETLDLRMKRAADSGRKVAAWLSNNTIIPCEVLHPELSDDPLQKDVYDRQCTGPGSTFSFVVEDNRELAFKILNGLQVFKLAVSLGGSESLVCHPASTTHSGVPLDMRQASGTTEGLIRLSVGLEDPDDLIADLELAFERAAK
ncbi:MAG: cystathionine gamma-synthase family protein [Pseudomonadota bacterium]